MGITGKVHHPVVTMACLVAAQLLFSLTIWVQSEGLIFYRDDEAITECASISSRLWIVATIFIVLELLVGSIIAKSKTRGILSVVVPTFFLTYMGSVYQMLVAPPEDSGKFCTHLLLGIVALLLGVLIGRYAVVEFQNQQQSDVLKGILVLFCGFVCVATVIGVLNPVNGSGAFFFGVAIAEVYKLFIIIFSALGFVTMSKDGALRKAFLLLMCGLVVTLCVLHSVGDAMIIFGVLMAYLYTTKPKLAIAVTGGGAALAAVSAFTLVKCFPGSYITRRLIGSYQFLIMGDTDSTHQLRRSLFVLLKDGLLGSGAGDTQYMGNLFGASNDYAFIGIAAMFGCIMAVAVVVAICALAVALRQTKAGVANNSALLTSGSMTAILLLAQAMIHVFGGLHILPMTGVNMPFLSAGGSSMLAYMLAIGVVLGQRLPRTALDRLVKVFNPLCKPIGKLAHIYDGTVALFQKLVKPYENMKQGGEESYEDLFEED